MPTDVNRRVLPGFSLSLGYTLLYMSLLVAIPLGAGFLKASHLSFAQFWAAVASDRALAAYRLTLGASLVSAVINVGIGVLVAWVLVRYEFPLKGLLDSLVDLPFALPTAVAGLVYSDLFVARGWYGRFLVPLGIQGAYSRLGIVLVLVFIGFPFVVRPRLRALARRVRLGGLRLRQHAVPDRNRPGPDRGAPRGVRLHRGDGHCRRPAHDLLPHALRDQSPRTLEQATPWLSLGPSPTCARTTTRPP